VRTLLGITYTQWSAWPAARNVNKRQQPRQLWGATSVVGNAASVWATSFVPFLLIQNKLKMEEEVVW